MAEGASSYVGRLLERTGLFSAEQIEDVLRRAQEEDRSVTDVVVREGYAPESAYLEALGTALHLPLVRLADETIPREVLDRLPTKAVFQYRVIPVSESDNTLVVAVHDPLNAGLRDTLRVAAGMRVTFALSTSAEIDKAARAFYGVGAETVDRMLQDGRFEVDAAETLGRADLSELDQEASVVKFVNQIIWEACRQGATDIHVEPMESELRIRYRIDGVLHQTPVPPSLNRFQAAIISRIKVMANLDIAEKRLPMDGRIGLRVEGQDIDIRVSTMPAAYGESVSLRLLQRKGQFIVPTASFL
jgi:type II secretory ATPase GspE/PulE/Tfp pilus assembly ATPase PilB-like protein